jgi:hypothetical protein
MRRLMFSALLLALGACSEPSISSRADGGGAGGESTPDAPPPPPQLPPSLEGGIPDLPPGFKPPGEGNPVNCAEEAYMAERVPLDLLLLVDRSMSMQQANKWDLSRAALTSFVSDPRSAGLGVGLQFFPLGTIDTPCNTDPDCGRVGGGVPQYCIERRVCVGPATTGTPPACGAPGDPACAAGANCVPLGICAATGIYCTGLGRPCPGGPATDLCKALGRTCRNPDFAESCNAPSFMSYSRPIAPLPGARDALARVLAETSADGGTPMVQAVQGTLTTLRAHQNANPTHRVALILATDGVPSNCGAIVGDPVTNVETQIRATRMATPSITTYAIGVFSPVEGMAGPAAVNRFAAAGGTGTAYVLNPTTDLNQTLLTALNKIRGAALPCEFNIPTPKMGMVDFGKVNVHYRGAAINEDILYVGRADKCDPMRGGWYYDTDPAMGAPKRVVLCEASCRRINSDAGGRVELGYGCKTRVID